MSFYDIEYDIIAKIMIHIRYHEFGYDINSTRKAKSTIMYDIIWNIEDAISYMICAYI